MSGPWFRYYVETLDDPKVQRLSDPLFRAWVNLLCVAKRHDGVIPANLDDIAFALRTTPAKARAAIEALEAAGLLDRCGNDDWQPHNWSGRQYESDSSASRVKRYRERKRSATSNGAGNVTEPVTVTPSETEQSRDRAEQSSDPNGSGGKPPNGRSDPVKALFDFGVSVLTESGVREQSARSEIGKWRKVLKDDGKLMSLLVSAQQNHAIEPLAYLEKAVASAQLKSKYGSGYVPPGVGG